MKELTELENSVLELSEAEYAKFREWFWEYENKKWDEKIEKDIAEKKLDTLANRAIQNFKHGKYKTL